MATPDKNAAPQPPQPAAGLEESQSSVSLATSSMTQKVDLSKLKTFRKNSFEELKKLIAAKTSIIYLQTWEEERAVTLIKRVAATGFKTPLHFFQWSETEGFKDEQSQRAEHMDVFKALSRILQEKDSGLFLFKDLPLFFDSPQLGNETKRTLIRKLHDVYHACKTTYKTLIITHPTIQIPLPLQKEITVTELDLPSEEELQTVLDQVSQAYPKIKVNLSEGNKSIFIRTAIGMSEDEARQAFTKCFIGKKSVEASDIDVIYEEKANIIKREGILEFVQNRITVEDIGGLENLKEWLRIRADFFSQEARDYGIKMPKGLLITGISGCGKSLCAQAVASVWNLPLYRLDMGRVYGGQIGNPEETMRRAIDAIEAVSPAILWMEEIEKGVAGYRQGDAGVTARIFSSFLTWMQEKNSPVFVAATANEISLLPPELIRKGRFDEIFYVDLPSEKEREHIFSVHLKKRNQDPATFNLINLAKATTNFNGAEIEQVVVSGLFEAFSERRALDNNDLYKVLGHMVPLATTMAEQIKEIKRWADTRATKASK